LGNISIKKATIINAVARYSTVIMNILFTAVLSRLLTPEEYGVVAIITVFTIFFSILSDMGLGTAIIQNKELTDKDVSSIFGFSLRLGIIISIVFCVLSIPISILYHNEVYKPICFILSIAIVFDTLNMVPNALLLKEKKFQLIGIRMVVINVITGVLTIILALIGFKYYALVFQSVISSVVTFIWNYSSTKPKFQFRYDKKSIEKIKSYSGFQFGFSLVNYFSRNLDNLLIGKIMGLSELAYYSKGYTLMLYPVANLTNVITPVLQPILSEHQNDKKYIYDQYLKIVKVLSLIGVFIVAYCFTSAKEIIMIMFGNQWTQSIPCFQILSLSIWGQMIAASSGAIFQSLGDTKNLFKCGIITTVLTVVCIIIGIFNRSILAVSYCIVIAYSFNFIITYVILIKFVFRYSLKIFFENIYKDIIILLFILLTISYLPISFNNIIYSAIVKFLICAILYISGLFITNQGRYVFLFANKIKVKFFKASNKRTERETG